MIMLIVPALLVLWICTDIVLPGHSSLTRFDGHEVARLETGMWRSYYGHHPVHLYTQLVELMRHQYHLPFWRACMSAWDAARAAVIFQRGHNRAEYELALPNLVKYYATICSSSDIPFRAERAARLELEWWIIHRERGLHRPRDLEQSLAAVQAVIYQRPEGMFVEHARARAAAMLLRDSAAANGGVSDRDWSRIRVLLDRSWVSLQTAVTH